MKILLTRLCMAIAAVLLVVLLSFISMRFVKGESSNSKTDNTFFVLDENQSLAANAAGNGISSESVDEIFGKGAAVSAESVKNLGLSQDELMIKLEKARVLAAEHSSKNFKLIALKFGMWAVFLLMIFNLIRRKRVTFLNRKILLGVSVLIFGIILGADPSPMGTVKDAIVLFGKSHVIFPPRLIALAVFIALGTILCNKFICAWGCQSGTLQDFIFRIGRNKKDTAGLIKQYKIPFVVSNTVRVIFFFAIIAGAFGWAFDIVLPVDPFTVFKPAKFALTGMVFVSVLFVLSLFIYRPWCHLFCPFGLTGWLAEKISVYKIKVNYNTCIACGACAEACPSTVMKQILIRKKTIPDCFSCGNCIETCPTGSISFSSGRRSCPPPEKFRE